MKLVLALGTTQTIAWASSTYLPAIVAGPLAESIGIARSTVFGAFSASLLVMAALGPRVGRLIDAGSGRGVLMASNVVLAAGLAALAAVQGPIGLFAAWAVIGIGMAMGLYDAAFAVLVRLRGREARGPITGITLMAGFASTVGWPLTAWLTERFGWREACLAWMAIHLLIALPLNRLCIPIQPSPERAADRSDAPLEEKAPQPGAFPLLAIYFAFTAFVTSAMAAHLPGLLVATGVTMGAALGASALLGPAQVAARLAEFLAERQFRYHPLLTARGATSLHPLGAAALLAIGGSPFAASLFAVVHGAGNGLITIAKGTLPLAIFGPAGYGERQGFLAVLARLMQACAPYAFGLVLDGLGVRAALFLSAGLSLAALATLFLLRR